MEITAFVKELNLVTLQETRPSTNIVKSLTKNVE